MATFTICDKCNKKQTDQEERWPNLSIHLGELKIKGMDRYLPRYHFCTDCAKIIFTKIVKFVKPKTK